MSTDLGSFAIENGKRLVNARTLAEILNVPVSWVYKKTMQGTLAIPHVKIGKYVRFKPDEVIRFFECPENKR